MPRRTPAIVLPSVEQMRQAARAEAPRVPAAVASAKATSAADALPAVAVPAVVLPPDDQRAAADRRRAPTRGILPPLPVTVRPTTANPGPVLGPAGPVPASTSVPAAAITQTEQPAAPAPSPPASSPAPMPGLPTAVAEAVSSPAARAVPAPAAVAAPAAPAVPAPDPDSPDPLERLRARLAERLAAVVPPDADSPYELQVSTQAVAGPRARKSAGGPSSGTRAAAKRPVGKLQGKGRGENDWAYEGEHGPQTWGGLCSSGRRQSPIDIRGGLPVALDPIAFHYQSGAFSVLDTGHTVQVNVAAGSWAQLNGRRFELQQFHFHRPSEETLDGRRFDLSVHLVHRDEQGRRLVVAVLVQQGTAQPVLRSVFGNLPLEKRQENRALSTLNPAELLPGEQGYYTYMGSLTTPPCSEDVQWVVLRHPVVASAEQIELFGRLYPHNIRPLQQAEGRRILQTR